MCGIAGIVGDASSDARGLVTAMLDTIDHRGPDDRGLFVSGSTAIGMTRLAIIDIAGGHQPMITEDERVRLVFNGEIYNHVELREQLRHLGHAFLTRSDTEVILRGYLEWGCAVFDRLDGMYAVAVDDARNGQFLLARDRFGEKPLYCSAGDPLVFASELKALHRAGAAAEVDEAALHEYLQLGYVSGSRSIWRGIQKVPAGHVLVRAEDGSRTLRPTSTVAAPDCEASNDVDELRHRLLVAVRSRLIADVPVGVLLSGGIDSSLVAWAASQLSPNIKTFTVGFDDRDRDETDAARATSVALATEHRTMRVTEREALAIVDDLPQVYDEPFADSSAIPTVIISRFARDEVKVVLTGDGGDELFSGYRRYAQLDELGRWHPLSLPLVGRALTPLSTSRSTLLSGLANRAALRHRSRPIRYEHLSSLLPSPIFGRVVPGAPGGALSDVLAETFAASDSRGAQLADLRVYLVDDLLVKMDRASMSASLEARVPLLAPVVADWALGLSDDALGCPGEKSLPRRLVEEVLPGDLASRRKQGFSVPLDDWLRGALRPRLDHAIHDGELVQSGVVGRRHVDVLVQRLDARRPGVASFLWAVLCFEQWRERWRSGG